MQKLTSSKSFSSEPSKRFLPVSQRKVKFEEDDSIKIEVLRAKSADATPITCYLVRPEKKRSVPLVVTASAGIHGSFFLKGTRHYDEFHLKICKRLQKSGFATLYVDKRGSYGYGKDFERQNELAGKEIEDLVSALQVLGRWKQGPKIQSIFLYGASRVCLLMFWVATRWPNIKGVILQSGFYDIKEQLKKMDRKYVREQLGSFTRESFPYQERSPLYHVDQFPEDIPVLLVHGPGDQKCDFSESQRFYNKLKAAGVPVALKPIEGLGHHKKMSYPGSPSGKILFKAITEFMENPSGIGDKAKPC